MLNPGLNPRAGNPEVTSIPQVDYSTSQRQLTSMQAEVAYLIKTPITTKPVVRTKEFVHDLASLRRLHQQNKLIFSSSLSHSFLLRLQFQLPTVKHNTCKCINNHDNNSQQSRRFLEAVPNKVFKHTRRPDYEILNNLKNALKLNFTTVPCTLGDGTHGYLGAMLTAAEYASATPINTRPFVDFLFPGAATVIPANSTGPQIAAIEHQFNKALCQ